MPQTILTAIFEVQPTSETVLRDRIENLRTQGRARDQLRQRVPALHFMSLTVFRDDLYDPIFVLEANFDGRPGPFWRQLEAALGEELRDMLRCCRPPRDRRAKLFAAVTLPGSCAPVAPLLEAGTVMPVARHQGNRGLDRNRILEEGRLFTDVQTCLDAGLANAPSPSAIHHQLRAALLRDFDWLERPAPQRISTGESVADWARFLGLLVALLVLAAATSIPGVLLGHRLSLHWWWTAVLALISAAVILGSLALAWHRNEVRDPPQDAPVIDPDRLRAMEQLEDRVARHEPIVQNHMISLVHIKPGVMRAVVARVALLFLGFHVRVTARSGYLKSMRTIHFAHWALVSNGSRLMFLSNYDGSWESYLDDFIEKAHDGLSAAWTHCIGFPPTRWLVRGGASHGGRFKQWARHSMRESQFWYSAYPGFSVNQIERHARVADGLRKRVLTEEEAEEWARDL